MYKISEINEKKIRELLDSLKIEVDEKVIKRFIDSVTSLEDQISKIKKFDVEGIEPMETFDFQVSDENYLIDDEIENKTTFNFENAKKNSSSTVENYFTLSFGENNE